MSKWVNHFRSKVKKMLPHSRKRVLDETYDIKDTLGGGLFSVVKKAVNKKTGELLAIKIYDKSRLTSYDRDCTASEVELLKSLKHPNIITVKDCIDTRSKLYLVEELMSGGDLLETIRKKKRFSEKEACRLFHQILTAIAFLHANGIAHRDIKPDNILLSGDSEDAIVKLADFGFAKRVGSGTLHTPCGSPVYTAPEIVREDSYDKSVDVWSAGVLLYIMLCGYPPFYHRDPSKLFEEIKKAVFDFPPEQWSSISDGAKDLVSSMLKADSTERISAQQALEHPWIVLTRADSSDLLSAKPESPPPSPPLTTNTTFTTTSTPTSTTSTSTATASAAEPVMDREQFKASVNRAIEQGTHFQLAPATSSPIWARRHKERRKSDKAEKSEKPEQPDNKPHKHNKNNRRSRNSREHSHKTDSASTKSDNKSDKSDRSESDSIASDTSRSQQAKETTTSTTSTTNTTSIPQQTTTTTSTHQQTTTARAYYERKGSSSIQRTDSRESNRTKESEDRSELASTVDAYSLSRTCSDTSEDGFSFLTNNPCD